MIRHRERGSGTVLVVAAIGVLALLLGAALALVSAVSASHQARAAADLAALAAADARLHGRGDPCGVASSVAGRNGSTLVVCEVGGAAVTVTVATATGWPGLGPARARARAGPSAA